MGGDAEDEKGVLLVEVRKKLWIKGKPQAIFRRSKRSISIVTGIRFF
jgi:hypothetical protein